MKLSSLIPSVFKNNDPGYLTEEQAAKVVNAAKRKERIISAISKPFAAIQDLFQRLTLPIEGPMTKDETFTMMCRDARLKTEQRLNRCRRALYYVNHDRTIEGIPLSKKDKEAIRQTKGVDHIKMAERSIIEQMGRIKDEGVAEIEGIELIFDVYRIQMEQSKLKS